MPSKDCFRPDWTNTPPKPGSYRSVFKWGTSDGFKHPNPRLYSLLKEELGMTDADFSEKKNTGGETVKCDIRAGLSNAHLDALKKIVGTENVSTSSYDRVKYSTGQTAEEILKLRSGIVDCVADAAVHPRDKEDVAGVVAYCNGHKIPIFAYGGGSSVTLGFEPRAAGISLVTGTHMNRVLELNETNQTATVQPGIMGPEYESALNNAPEMFKTKMRYTCGHFPQSFEYSTVGGWIAALGSGQASSYYGDMYDIVLSQEYVTPAGNFKTLDFPATATGPKINDIMKGSEGTFGILVSATLKIFRHMPENRFGFSFIFPKWQNATDAARKICQGEFGMPSVFRISDPEETDVALKLYGIEGTPLDAAMGFRGFKSGSRCLCIGHTEGERNFSKNVKKNIRKICKANGGMYLTGRPVKNWEKGRYKDPYMREDLYDFGIMVDTLETGVTWDNFRNLYRGVREFVKSRPNTICMTHASHFYPQGTNLYFIFIARMDDIGEYKRFQHGIIDRISNCGGSLSHHHGVGKMLAPWMEKHLGTEQMDVLRALKRHFDPNGIMNPGGTLGL